MLIPTTVLTNIGGGTVLIEEKIAPSGGSASFDFQSIPGTYSALRIIMAVLTEAAGARLIWARFNNDSGANYDSEQFVGNGNTASAAQTSAATAAVVASCGTTSETFPGCYVVEIPFYAGTTWKKQTISNGVYVNTTTRLFECWGGFWNNTAAITRITLVSNGAEDLKEGSVARLYGVS